MLRVAKPSKGSEIALKGTDVNRLAGTAVTFVFDPHFGWLGGSMTMLKCNDSVGLRTYRGGSNSPCPPEGTNVG